VRRATTSLSQDGGEVLTLIHTVDESADQIQTSNAVLREYMRTAGGEPAEKLRKTSSNISTFEERRYPVGNDRTEHDKRRDDGDVSCYEEDIGCYSGASVGRYNSFGEPPPALFKYAIETQSQKSFDYSGLLQLQDHRLPLHRQYPIMPILMNSHTIQKAGAVSSCVLPEVNAIHKPSNRETLSDCSMSKVKVVSVAEPNKNEFIKSRSFLVENLSIPFVSKQGVKQSIGDSGIGYNAGVTNPNNVNFEDSNNRFVCTFEDDNSNNNKVNSVNNNKSTRLSFEMVNSEFDNVDNLPCDSDEEESIDVDTVDDVINFKTIQNSTTVSITADGHLVECINSDAVEEITLSNREIFKKCGSKDLSVDEVELGTLRNPKLGPNITSTLEAKLYKADHHLMVVKYPTNRLVTYNDKLSDVEVSANSDDVKNELTRAKKIGNYVCESSLEVNILGSTLSNVGLHSSLSDLSKSE